MLLSNKRNKHNLKIIKRNKNLLDFDKAELSCSTA